MTCQVKKNHPSRAKAAEELHEHHQLPDVAELLGDLNETRKSEAYGDVEAPELNAEDVVTAIQEYVSKVEKLLAPGEGND